jgi:hypothetical protein
VRDVKANVALLTRRSCNGERLDAIRTGYRDHALTKEAPNCQIEPKD